MRSYTTKEAIVTGTGKKNKPATFVRVRGEWQFDQEGVAKWLGDADSVINDDLADDFERSLLSVSTTSC